MQGQVTLSSLTDIAQMLLCYLRSGTGLAMCRGLQEPGPDVQPFWLPLMNLCSPNHQLCPKGMWQGGSQGELEPAVQSMTKVGTGAGQP